MPVTDSPSKKAGMRGLRFAGIAFAISIISAFHLMAGGLNPYQAMLVPMILLIVLTVVIGINPPSSIQFLIAYLSLMTAWALLGYIIYLAIRDAVPSSWYNVLAIAEMLLMMITTSISIRFLIERNRLWALEKGRRVGNFS